MFPFLRLPSRIASFFSSLLRSRARVATAVPEPVALPPPEPAAEPPALQLVPTEPKPARKPYKPSIAPLRNALDDAVSDLIERIAGINISNMEDRLGVSEYESALSYLHGCDFHYIDRLAERMEGGSRWYHQATTPAEAKDIQDISWPIDIAIVCESRDGCLNFDRMTTVTAAELRGLAKIFAPRMAMLANACLKPDGTWYAQKSPIGLINGKWTPLNAGMTRQVNADTEVLEFFNQQRRKEVSDAAMLLQSVAITERYSWHVALGRKNGPRICLPTNPRGCLELFKTREKRDDENRRAALKHWVQNHYRESEDGGLAYVRDHLRGATEFTWRDLDCEIFVSQFDLEKNEFFKHQADQWRSQRQHNRVKVRIKRA